MNSANSSEMALSVSGLSKTYKDGNRALNNVTFSVPEGDFYALLGRNGAGKSTTIGIICSLVAKSAGKVHVFGTDIDQNFPKAKSYIGVVPQEINFNQFETPWNIVINHAGYYGVTRSCAQKQAEKYLTALGLWDGRNAMSRKLSGGMKRRLMIARALMHEPRLLILDEPTAGIDFETRLDMWDYMEQLNRNGTTIILTTHYLQEAEKLCRNFGVIDDGELILNVDRKSLFAQLYQETYILDLSRPVQTLPEQFRSELKLLDDATIEVDVPRGQNLNILFADLSRHGIEVASVRNKSNRLETLFIELLKLDADSPEISDLT